MNEQPFGNLIQVEQLRFTQMPQTRVPLRQHELKFRPTDFDVSDLPLSAASSVYKLDEVHLRKASTREGERNKET
jgi:hypothetical protein